MLGQTSERSVNGKAAGASTSRRPLAALSFSGQETSGTRPACTLAAVVGKDVGSIEGGERNGVERRNGQADRPPDGTAEPPVDPLAGAYELLDER